MIKVSGITNIEYLNTIPVYIDTLLRLTQAPHTTKVSLAEVKQLCEKQDTEPSDEYESDEGEIEDIVAPVDIVGNAPQVIASMESELGIDEEKEPDVKKEAPNMLDLLMASDDETSEDDEGDDDDDDDDDDFSGGAIYDMDGGEGDRE